MNLSLDMLSENKQDVQFYIQYTASIILYLIGNNICVYWEDLCIAQTILQGNGGKLKQKVQKNLKQCQSYTYIYIRLRYIIKRKFIRLPLNVVFMSLIFYNQFVFQSLVLNSPYPLKFRNDYNLYFKASKVLLFVYFEIIYI